MIRSYCIIVIYLFIGIPLFANNVRVKNLQWDPATLNSQDVLTMTFNISWENSWRDDYNYDAAYVFFKFRRVDAVNESWHHLYLQDEGNQIATAYSEDYDCWVSPLSVEGVNLNTGIYVFRKEKGAGGNSVDVTVKWNIKQQVGITLNSSEFADHKILVSAFALEMVYIPRGPFRIGDGLSNKGFRKSWQPILREYDLVSDTLNLLASSGNPRLAANHANDNTANESNAWVGTANTSGTGGGDKNASHWIIDFGIGNEKRITYFGINGASYQPTYYPVAYQLEGSTSPAGPWDNVVWSGSGKDTWSMNGSAYPVEKAIKVTNPGYWRCYRLRIKEMNAGYPIVKAIAMTDRNLEDLWDHTVVVDAPTILKDSVYYLGARDGSVWSGSVPETFPDGYRGFYAMKYEISQEQYARFLNKLSADQQNGLLDKRLEQIEEGKFVFGDDKLVDHRNGIMLSSEIEGRSSVFSNNYNSVDDSGKEDDGQNIACNYMSVNDMLAYADWAGLRPLTEMEYEKMCRPLYPYLPAKGEYAWNSTRIVKAATLYAPGAPGERTMTGNANYDNETEIGGPLRTGSFASVNSDRENAGASFWGCMELSGNLAEMYYNVNNQGITVGTPKGSGTTLGGHTTYHGDGYLSADGHCSLTSNAWKAGPEYIALRGGSYASTNPAELAVSDRTYHINALKSVTERLPNVTFRLGRSVPERPQLLSALTLENEECTAGTKDVEDVSEENRTEYYRITGNTPENLRSNTYTYIWYMQETGDKYWRIMEGKNDKDLVFEDFRTDSINIQNYSFRRKVSSPFADSETSSNFKASIVIEAISLGATSYTLSGNDYTAPFDMTVVSAVPATFSWEYDGIPLAAYKQDQYSSNYKPMRGHFNNRGEAGDYVVTLKVNKKSYEIKLHIDEATKTYMSSNIPSCGKMMYDTRDNEIYGTVQIGTQCWMTENLRYVVANAKEGYGNPTLNGSYYTWYLANNNSWSSGSKQGLCPQGWRLPTDAEWQTLLNYVGNDARKLKSAYNWQYVNTTQRGTNTTGFSAVGTGKYSGSSSVLGYNLQHTRFMTSNRANSSYTDGSYVELYYNSATTSGILRPWGYNWGNIEAGSVRCIK